MGCSTKLINCNLCFGNPQVKWAPKRRESYYLMSERVYNDRLMMKLRNEEESPLLFDFSNTEGETDNLHDLQKLIQSTSSHLKNMKLDTKFNEYDYNFDEGQRRPLDNSLTETQAETGDESGKSEMSKGKRKVTFSDHVTHSGTDASFAMSFARSRSKRSSGDLDPSDIEINVGSRGPEDERMGRPDESFGDLTDDTLRSKGLGDKYVSGNGFSSFRSRDSSLGLLSALRGSSRFSDDDYSSDFTGSSTGDQEGESRSRKSGLDSDWTDGGEESTTKRLHKNPHCKHSLTRKAKEYYKKLPKLLRTSELRDKLPQKRIPKARELGHDVDHSCMEAHKTAYERALTLARFKSLPASYSFLAGKTSGRSFSYFSDLPGAQKEVEFKGDDKPATTKKKADVRPEGRKAIFGDIDMNDFYVEEDELLYYINPEELKQVVASTVSTDESSRGEEKFTSTSATTSRTTTTNKPFSSLGSEGLSEGDD